MDKYKRKIIAVEADRLYDAGLSCSAIAKHFGVSRQAVYFHFKRRGMSYTGWRGPFSDDDGLFARLAKERNERYAELEKRRKIGAKSNAIVTEAIAKGVLVPLPCEICSANFILCNGNRGIHAHHDDYTKPLSVRWLCPKHHSEWHRDNEPRYE